MRTPDLFDLSGRVALVTGGGRGLGRYIAMGLAEAGADVVLASRDLERCQATAAEIEALGGRALPLALDLAREEQVESALERALEAMGRLDVLVNNAAATWGAPVLDFPDRGWDKVFSVNVRGTWQLSQRIARQMREIGGGSIVNVASIAALRGVSDAKEPSIAYSASKGALISLTRDLAVKLAPDHIRVNCISPGAFDTDMFAWVRDDPARLADFEGQVPMARPGGEDDIKGVVVFLASAASAYVTGANLVVDGGYSIVG